MSKATHLKEYIEKFFDGNQSAFGRAQESPVNRYQVSRWVTSDYFI